MLTITSQGGPLHEFSFLVLFGRRAGRRVVRRFVRFCSGRPDGRSGRPGAGRNRARRRLQRKEATFFRYHDANGVEDGDAGGDDTEFDNDANLRLTAGYVGCDGLGARVRYWDYDEVAVAAGNDAIFVDTYTLDFEVFQTLDVGSCTCVEVSGGVRYNDFFFIREDGAADVTAFDGLGGIIGIKAHRDICGGFGVCAGLREVILADDMFQNGLDDETDVIRNVTEIALGVNYTSCNWSIHAGYEWQIWSNYVESAGPFNLDREMSDIGFVGFVVGAEYAY
jgi:hypothetical protein